MLKEERLDYILKRLKADQKVLQTDLSSALQVSEDTVRRDLESLAQDGLLIKVRGGAIPHSPNPYSFQERSQLHEKDKRRIAEKALTLLHDGQTIILDGGTSTLTLAKLLPPQLKLNVVTNSVPVAMQLIEHPSVEVIFTGGRINKDSRVTGGLDTLRMLRRFRADLCFLGVCSLHPELGVTGLQFEEAELKTAMVESAGQIAALATLDKMGTAEPYKVCEITDIDIIVTDQPEDDSLSIYKTLGLRII
ncbi:DeoR/GlpR family DNA-binding transcription regulator [Chitinophaga lutea]